MPDKKLTDSEIVKDLNEAEDLENVLLYCKNPNKEVMTPIKITDIRDLINRLQAENEELKETVKVLRVGVEQAHIIRKDGKNPFNLLKAEIKAEAYKEFAEKLKDEYTERFLVSGDILIETIDNLLKELVGEDK